MSTITAPGPLLPLDAPLPVKPDGTLLDAAFSVTDADGRWRAGAFINGYPAGPAATHDPCASGTNRAKSADNSSVTQMASAFTVVLGGICTAASIGPDAGWYKQRLRAAFEAVESNAVERYLADGDGIAPYYLGDSNMEVLGSGAVKPVEGLALLEEEIRVVGGGMIHAAPATASYWVQNGGITLKAGVFRTGLGTLVAVGGGYVDVQPDGEAAAGAGEDWAFASGLVQVRRSDGPVDVLAESYAQSIDRSSNEVTFYAERDYLLAWIGRQDASDNNHVQAGVLIDRLA